MIAASLFVGLYIAANAVQDPELVKLMPARHGHRAHVVSERLVVLGGFAAGDASPDRGAKAVSSYSFRERIWKELPSLKTPKSFFGSVVIEGAIYAVGESIERLSPKADAWTTVCQDKSLPSSHFSVAAIGKTIYILGTTLLAFDVESGKLTQMEAYPGMKEGDHFEVFAALDDSLHVIGGLDGDSFDARKSHWKWQGGKWQRLPDAPITLFAKFAVVEVADDNLFFLSAQESLVFRRGDGTWNRLAPMPQALAMPASFIRDGWIHVLGGMPVDEPARTMAYSIADDRWIDLRGLR